MKIYCPKNKILPNRLKKKTIVADMSDLLIIPWMVFADLMCVLSEMDPLQIWTPF